MPRHTLTHADELFAGAQWAGGYQGGKRGISLMPIHRMVIEDIPAGDVDGIATAQTTSGAAELTLDGAFVSDGVATIDGARNIAVVSSDAGDTSQTVTVTGRDIVGNKQVEEIGLNGTTEVVGAKAFSEVSKVEVDASLAGNITVGTSATLANIELGLDARLLNAYDVIHAFDGAGAAEGGTFTVADTATPTATTGDARGTYNPGNAPDGSADFILMYVPDLTKEGFGVNYEG